MRARAPRPAQAPHVDRARVTLSSTVICGKRLKRWNTIPISSRTARIVRSSGRRGRPSGPGSADGCPLIVIVPAVDRLEAR